MTADTNQTVYPDISDILRRKAEGRKQNAARSFSEKIDILESLRDRLAPINRARHARQLALRRDAQAEQGD